MKNDPRLLDGESLELDDVVAVARHRAPCILSPAAQAKVRTNRDALEAIVSASDEGVYGVNTGFGELASHRIDSKDAEALQLNLVRSHAAGVGDAFGREETRAIIVARANALARGHSAVRPEIIERLLAMLAHDILPVVPRVGSLGASGDLAPLAHVALAVAGEGWVHGSAGSRIATSVALKRAGLEPMKLEMKEGLALMNGTSAMVGVGALVLTDAWSLVRQAEILGALAAEALRGSSAAYEAPGHEIARPHPGQIASAANLRALLEGSARMRDHSEMDDAMDEEGHPLQDAYTLRCIPQIVGAVRDTLRHASGVVERDLNASTDNPLLFENGAFFHGGNFHGQPVAFAMDFAKTAIIQLSVLSERRTNRLLHAKLNRGLPEFLVAGSPGLHSGFAGTQYPATAMVAENRALATPASIQSIPANADNQDVVSMGLTAARMARAVVDNTRYVLAIEWLAAAQAIDVAGCAESLATATRAAHDALRAVVPTVSDDRFMSDDIAKAHDALQSGALEQAIDDAGLALE